jgi:hypothetical protein
MVWSSINDWFWRHPLLLTAEQKIEKIMALLYTWIVANKLEIWNVVSISDEEVKKRGGRIVLEKEG